MIRNVCASAVVALASLWIALPANAQGLTAGEDLVFFGVLKGGESVSRIVTVSNEGPEMVQDLQVDANSEVFVVDNGCEQDLYVGETCYVQVTFSPTEDGAFVDNLIIEGSDSLGSVFAKVRMEGASYP